MHTKTIGLIAHTGKRGVAELINAIAGEFQRFSISMIDPSATMIERFVSTCGQIGVMTNTPDSGSRIGPPADNEYAVDPVGVATTNPSALNSVSGSPFTRVRNMTRRESSPRLRTASFSASILFVLLSPRVTLASSSAR